MKTYQLHSNPISILSQFPAFGKRLEAVPDPGTCLLSLGGDLEKAGVYLCAGIGLQAPLALRVLSRPEMLTLVGELRARGFRVAVGLEACGFGWEFQRQLRMAGAEVLTFAPEPLNGKRKTNRRDAAALARLVAARLVHGDERAGRVVREPNELEQRRRALCRHRQQLVGIRGKLEAFGRNLLHDFGVHDAPECWWGRKMWRVLEKRLAQESERGQWLLELLGPQRELALQTHQRILDLDEHLEAIGREVVTVPMPKGLGAATATLVVLEMVQPGRFNNRKQVGSYLGCSPREHSTGEGQLLGSIDKMGNKRLRSALTEAVWRLLRWEPTWRGFSQWGTLLREKNVGAVRKKKAVIACVRLLGIDLWRLLTARATLTELGFAGSASPHPDAAADDAMASPEPCAA